VLSRSCSSRSVKSRGGGGLEIAVFADMEIRWWNAGGEALVHVYCDAAITIRSCHLELVR
jgi:hypothetical protein